MPLPPRDVHSSSCLIASRHTLLGFQRSKYVCAVPPRDILSSIFDGTRTL
jgi:hypothetical protein